MWLAAAFCKSPLALSFFDSFNVLRYFEFIVDKTINEFNLKLPHFPIVFLLPFLTVFDAFKLPEFNCCEAKFKPLDKSWRARIKRIKRSARLQCSGACGCVRFWTVGDSVADINAESGAQRKSATSRMQSVSARTKLSFANVSLCSR